MTKYKEIEFPQSPEFVCHYKNYKGFEILSEWCLDTNSWKYTIRNSHGQKVGGENKYMGPDIAISQAEVWLDDDAQKGLEA